MKSDIYVKKDHSFAFGILMQIIRLKRETGEKIDDELDDLIRLVQFDIWLEPISEDDLKTRIPELVKEISTLKFERVDIFSRFEPKELTFRLTSTLERYFSYPLKLSHLKGKPKELPFLEKLRSEIFSQNKGGSNSSIKSVIKKYKIGLNGNKVEKLARIYRAVFVGFWDYPPLNEDDAKRKSKKISKSNQLNSETEIQLIAGLVAIKLGLIDLKKLDYADQGGDVYNFLVGAMKGAILNLKDQNLI